MGLNIPDELLNEKFTHIDLAWTNIESVFWGKTMKGYIKSINLELKTICTDSWFSLYLESEKLPPLRFLLSL
jgi:hypothetical protein